jgi:hypothetical protein
MHDSSKQVPVRVERIVALLVLDHPEGCSRSDLKAALADLDQGVEDALSFLQAKGVIRMYGGKYLPSQSAEHLNALDLIAV